MTYNSWTRFGSALEWYRALGYEYVDLPWIVAVKYVDYTRPAEQPPRLVTDGERTLGSLVGSGEQSFIEALFENTLPGVDPHKGDKLMTITPCFRTEAVYDGKLVCPQFMKLELFSRLLSPLDLANHAKKFLYRWAPGILLVQTQEGFDLVYNGIELGSYGRRTLDGRTFTYGTGLAEPRTTHCRTPVTG